MQIKMVEVHSVRVISLRQSINQSGEEGYAEYVRKYAGE